MLAEVTAAALWPGRLVIRIEPAAMFCPAEVEQEDYFDRNLWSGYCHAVIAPKVTKSCKSFADQVRRPAA